MIQLTIDDFMDIFHANTEAVLINGKMEIVLRDTSFKSVAEKLIERSEIKDPHETSNVKCDLCGHSWVAVRPLGVEKLECPNCGNMVNFENI